MTVTVAVLGVLAAALGVVAAYMGNSGTNVTVTNKNDVIAPIVATPQPKLPSIKPIPDPQTDGSARAPAATTIAEPEYCNVSRSQTTREILAEGDAQFFRQDYAAAIQRYYCVESRLAAERGMPMRAEVARASSLTNRTPTELERAARKLHELFNSIPH